MDLLFIVVKIQLFRWKNQSRERSVRQTEPDLTVILEKTPRRGQISEMKRN